MEIKVYIFFFPQLPHDLVNIFEMYKIEKVTCKITTKNMHTQLDNNIPSFRFFKLIIKKKGGILHVAKINNKLNKLK